MATEAQRHHMKATIDMMALFRPQLDYPPGDQRTNRDNVSWGLTEQQMEHMLNAGGRAQFDCSEFCPWILRCAGCWHWSQPGYTGSHLQLLHQQYTNPKIAQVGALIVVGMEREPTGHHECIVYKPDPGHGNPMLASHGHAGLDFVLFNDMIAAQPGYKFLSIAHL